MVNSVAFSPDEKWLAAGEDRTGITRLWDVHAAREVRSCVPPRRRYDVPWNQVGFSGDGKAVFSAREDAVSAYDVSTGKELHCFEGKEDCWLLHASFAPGPILPPSPTTRGTSTFGVPRRDGGRAYSSATV
jgi:WD40 repeat protein